LSIHNFRVLVGYSSLFMWKFEPQNIQIKPVNVPL
jgi:hypothetical protein